MLRVIGEKQWKSSTSLQKKNKKELTRSTNLYEISPRIFFQMNRIDISGLNKRF